MVNDDDGLRTMYDCMNGALGTLNYNLCHIVIIFLMAQTAKKKAIVCERRERVRECSREEKKRRKLCALCKTI